MTLYTQVTHPGYQQPPPPSQFPVPPTYPISSHASADSVLGPIPPQPGTGHFNDYTRPPPVAFPDPRAPDRSHPPPYPFSVFAAPGRPGVPESEPPYPSVPSYTWGPSSYAPHTSERPHPQVRQPNHNLSLNRSASCNPPAWLSPTRTLSSFACHRIILFTRSFTCSAITSTSTTPTTMARCEP